MAKMSFDIAERHRVKLQCLRLMLSLRLDSDRQDLIADFVNSYLILTVEETRALMRELQSIQPEEARAVLKVSNEWTKEGERRGRRLGERKGKREGIKIGVELGEQRGRAEERRKTVLNMHAKGFAADVIASVTELEPEEITRIIGEAT